MQNTLKPYVMTPCAAMTFISCGYSEYIDQQGKAVDLYAIAASKKVCCRKSYNPTVKAEYFNGYTK